MTTVSITLSDDLKSRLETKAVESGFDRVEQYIESILQAETQEVLEDDDLEQLLLRRLDAPADIELTDQFVAQFKERVARRRRNGGTSA